MCADQTRWPRRPYCTDDLSAGLKIRDLRRAITCPYIQANPPHMRIWSIHDVDRPGAAIAWEHVNLPPPAWAATNRENAHAHLVWGLSAPVLTDNPDARQAPIRYLAAIESMMREMLGADPGFCGLITKNPAHEMWRILRGPRMHYELGELAEYLPGIEKHRPKRGSESIGIGRNITLFRTLRKWALPAIRPFWGGGIRAWNAWMDASYQRALIINADLFGGRMLDEREVWHIAKSVGKWVWRNTTAAGFKEYQSAMGKRSGAARLAKSADQRAEARIMRASGGSTRQIAKDLGVNQSTVARWCADQG